jgi:hypothetical protein
MRQGGLPNARRVTFFTFGRKRRVARYAGVRFVFGGLVAAEAGLARALELRDIAHVTGKTRSFCVSSVQRPSVL